MGARLRVVEGAVLAPGGKWSAIGLTLAAQGIAAQSRVGGGGANASGCSKARAFHQGQRALRVAIDQRRRHTSPRYSSCFSLFVGLIVAAPHRTAALNSSRKMLEHVPPRFVIQLGLEREPVL